MQDDDLVLAEVDVESSCNIVPIEAIPPSIAEIAFQDYLNLGPSRSVTALHRQYLAKLAKNPHAPVPTDNLYTIMEWERIYNWRTLAWEHDVEGNRAFAIHRKEIMSAVYEGQLNQGRLLMKMAESNIAMLAKKKDEHGNPVQVLSPQEALMFMKEGVRIQKESQEAILKLKDPKEQDVDNTGDLFDNIRKLGLLQFNMQVNNYGATSK